MGRMTLPEAANAMGLSRQRVHAIVKAGRMKAERVGGVWIVDAAEVNRYMAEPHPGGRPPKSSR